MTTNGNNEENLRPASAPTANLPNGTCLWREKARESLCRMPRTFLYLIHSEVTGLYKIGHTTNPKARLAQLQRDSAFPLQITHIFDCIGGSGAIFEKLMHDIFRDRRTHGEWFNLSKEDVVMIDQVNQLVLHMCKVVTD